MSELTKTEQDRAAMDSMLRVLRERFPTAVRVDLTTSDQNRYGFVLCSVRDAQGSELYMSLSDSGQYAVEDQVDPYLGDLDWDGVVGEDKYGNVTLNIPSA